MSARPILSLALLLYEYSPYGGKQRNFARIVGELTKRGHHCRIYCTEWQGDAAPGSDLRRVPVSAFREWRRNEQFAAWVQRDLAADPVDGIVGFDKMPDLDVYFAADTCFLDRARREAGWLYRRGGRFRYFAACEEAVFGEGSSTEILLLSEVEKVSYLQHYETARTRLQVLPPGIDRDRICGQDAADRRRRTRADLKLASGEHVQLFVGSDFTGKGLERAIRALAHARETQPHQVMRLLVVGRDKVRRYKRLAKKLDVAECVQFLGTRDDIPDLLLGADVLVHPALEAAGGAILLEALVAGLPVITTDTCGYAHHIADAKAGMVLRSPFRQEDLNSAVLRTLDGVYRHQCRETGLVYARITDLYSLHSTAADTIERLLAHVASGHEPDAGI